MLEDDDRPFWATVNICDTEDSPNALGVRTSVPGNGSDSASSPATPRSGGARRTQEWLTVGAVA